MEDDPTKAERQRRWRARKAEKSITVHLNELELEILDTIAAAQWEEAPYDPRIAEERPKWTPSRTSAIRALIWAQMGSSAPRAVERLEEAKLASRAACGAFWRREASWRRVTPASFKTWPTPRPGPEPPWRSLNPALRILEDEKG